MQEPKGLARKKWAAQSIKNTVHSVTIAAKLQRNRHTVHSVTIAAKLQRTRNQALKISDLRTYI